MLNVDILLTNGRILTASHVLYCIYQDRGDPITHQDEGLLTLWFKLSIKLAGTDQDTELLHYLVK